MMERGLEHTKYLILPGGNRTVSQCHVTRTVCRRAERKIVALVDLGYDVKMELQEFFNRLSDYYFVLSRKIEKDYNILSKNWISVVD